MTRPLIVLCPGTVRSTYDGQLHRITSDRLADLYRLRRGEWISRAEYERSTWRYHGKPVATLHPRTDGQYCRPVWLDPPVVEREPRTVGEWLDREGVAA